jgi:hypothetical protein
MSQDKSNRNVRILFQVDNNRYMADSPCDDTLSDNENIGRAVQEFAARLEQQKMLPCNELTLEMEALRSVTTFLNTSVISKITIVRAAIIDAKFTGAPKDAG